MTTPEPINVLDAMLPIINSAIAEWQEENSEEKLKSRVKSLLDENSKTATMKLLGFDSRYGEQWSLDHFNGRSGNSAAGDFIRQVQATAIKEWLTTVGMPVLTVAEKKHLNAGFRAEYISQLRTGLRQKVMVTATEHLDALVAEFVVPTQVGNYIKAKALIDPSS
jgi:uncharacterized protein YnzC (UPF0291/DUF896 family)